MSREPILPEHFVTSAFCLDGRVAAVTGAGSGLGAAIAAGLAQAGATIAVLDVDVEKAAEVVGAIAGAGGEAFELRCDVTDSASVRAAACRIVERTGRVDVLVNSAGTAFRGPAEDFPEEQLDRVLAVNLKGTYLSCQTFGRYMLERCEGSIVNIASIGGFIAYPHASAYLASKGGVVQLTRGLALEWIGKVRVNGIAPTLFDTPLTTRGARSSSVTSDFIEARFLRTGLPQAHHVVGAAVFLASDASALVTGHTLPVDDGYLIA
jgi:NAD(P)-dependent dehydrogenase (short-subunit alcohol dehydrogenase family)